MFSTTSLMVPFAAMTLVLSACQQEGRKGTVAEKSSTVKSEAAVDNGERLESDTTPQVVPASSDDSVATALVKRWNRAHSTGGREGLSQLYADEVFFYGKLIKSSEVEEKKRQFIDDELMLRQNVVSDVAVRRKGEVLHVSFEKEVVQQGKTRIFPAYLVLVKSGASWKIAAESDQNTDENLAKMTEGAVGDYNGDGTPEVVRVVPPGLDCELCDCKLVFSNPKLASIHVENCLGGIPENEGDLNDDGADEIGLLPNWHVSYWRGYRVYTMKGESPHLAISVLTHANQWDQGVDAIEKDPSRPGHVITRSTRMKDHRLITRSEPLE